MIQFCNPNKRLPSNEVKRIKHNILTVSLLTLWNYFWKYENFYFLVLSIFQLLTINILPSEWSPTGPYSTALPLLICVIAEMLINIIKWINDYYLEKKENNTIYKCIYYVDKQFMQINKINKHLFPGDVIHLKKNDIVPIDGIFIDSDTNEQYSKISLSLLTGEPFINFINKAHNYFKLHDFIGSKLIINNYFNNDLHNIEANVIMPDNTSLNITGKNFIPAGSIVKSNDVYIWVIACGTSKKNYIKKNLMEHRKKNRIDIFVGNYMININGLILLFLVILSTAVKLFTNGLFISNIPFYIIQSWILLNGIIPFSVKILLILTRNLQTIINNKYNANFTINNSLQIDDIGKVNKLLTDKTGTLTKNELEFTKLISLNSNDIIDIEQFYNKKIKANIDVDLSKCLGICIHQNDGEFSTQEDKTLSDRYHLLNNYSEVNEDEISLYINNQTYKYKYIHLTGLDFTFERKLSSKIVKDIDGKYYIYCKGALNVINNKIKKEHQKQFDNLDKIMSSTHPELRLLACAYKEISEDDLQICINNSSGKLLETDLNFLGIIGIRDNLQDNIPQTIKLVNNYGINVCLLTGDRKITAVTLAKEAGIIIEDKHIYEINFENLTDDNIKNIKHITNTTMLFGSDDINNILNSNKFELFCYCVKKCRNFVAYNLIPDHKKLLTDILESNDIKTLTIGDGFNDIGMFNVSSLSIAIKNNQIVENNADISVKEFQHLIQFFDYNIDIYHKNSKLINFTFYRCSLVIFSIMTFYMLTFNQISESVFNGFVIQGFNFAWCLSSLAYGCFNSNLVKYNRLDYFTNKYLKLTSVFYTTLWNILGIFSGIILTLLNYYFFKDILFFNDLHAFVLIILLNIKLFFNNGINKYSFLCSSIGIINFIIYMIYMDTVSYVFSSLLTADYYYWLFFGIIVLINYFN